jgi:hypothetical protein
MRRSGIFEGPSDSAPPLQCIRRIRRGLARETDRFSSALFCRPHSNRAPPARPPALTSHVSSSAKLRSSSFAALQERTIKTKDGRLAILQEQVDRIRTVFAERALDPTNVSSSAWLRDRLFAGSKTSVFGQLKRRAKTLTFLYAVAPVITEFQDDYGGQTDPRDLTSSDNGGRL